MNFESLGQILTSLWTIWAFALFVGILAWAMWPSNGRRFEQDAKIPLNDEA